MLAVCGDVARDAAHVRAKTEQRREEGRRGAGERAGPDLALHEWDWVLFT